jgi:hypothetical protein
MTTTIEDPVFRALRAANPVAEDAFATLPPLGDLPRRAPSPATRRALAASGALAAAGVAAVALIPSGSSAPGGHQLLARALAASDGQPSILHWRSHVQPDALQDYTEDVWLHVAGDGVVDQYHAVRLDGPYAGRESVITGPSGIENPQGAVDRSRDGAAAPIRETRGMALGQYGFTGVVTAAQDADAGTLDTGDAVQAEYDHHPAWEVRLSAKSTVPVAGHLTSISATLWVDRATGAPLGVRYGAADQPFAVEQVQQFERLPDDAAHRALLDFAG